MNATTTAIVEYSPTAAALAELATRMANVVYDVSTPKGLAAAKADRAEVRDLRVALEKKRVEIKSPALKRCNEIDTEAKRITAELLKYEGPPDQAIKAHEARIEAERQALVDAELKRVNDIAERIASLEGNKLLTPASGSQLITEHIDDLHAIDIDDSFAEFRDTAELTKSAGLARLAALRTAAVEHETAQAKLKKEQEELARQRAEQDARDAIAKKNRDEIARVAEEALRKDRELFAAEQAEANRKQREENERIAAAQEVIDKANRELEARQQAERDAQAEREHQERVAVIARENARLDAEREAEAQRIANYRPSFDEIVAVLAAQYKRDTATVRTWISEPKAERKAA